MSSKELCSRTRRSARIAAARSVPTKAKDDELDADQQMATEPSVENTVEMEKDTVQEQDAPLLSLNDDCLLAIYSYLKMEDLCALKDCCQRLSFLALFIVERAFRKKKFNEYFCLPSKPRPSDTDFEEKALMAFKFGELINHVEIVGRAKDSWRIGPVLKDCTFIKSFRLRNVAMGIIPVVKLKAMLANIETLELLCCRVSTRKLFRILNSTKSLKHLLIHGKMPMSSDLLSAIVEHENIESICLRMTGIYNVSAEEFRSYAEQLQPLQKLKNLEILYIRYPEIIAPAMDVLAKIDSLEELTLSWFKPTVDFIQRLATFRNLRTFKIYTYKDIPDKIVDAAHNFTVTKKRNSTEVLDGFGVMPDFTLTLERNNLVESHLVEVQREFVDTHILKSI